MHIRRRLPPVVTLAVATTGVGALLLLAGAWSGVLVVGPSAAPSPEHGVGAHVCVWAAAATASSCYYASGLEPSETPTVPPPTGPVVVTTEPVVPTTGTAAPVVPPASPSTGQAPGGVAGSGGMPRT